MRATARSEQIFAEHQHSIYVRTDKLFAWLLVLEWVGSIVTAMVISPYSWSGMEPHIHAHVHAAIFLGGAIVSLPCVLATRFPGTTLTRHIIAVAQMLLSAVLIHLTGGRIETHFHVFGSLAFLAFYRDWRVLISASTVVALDHLLRGVYWPQSVYGISVATSWRWLEHFWWVAFEDFFLIISIRQSIAEMHAIAERQAKSELARNEAESLSKVKDEFLATLSHELRTPLTSAYGWMAILRRDSNSDQKSLERGLTIIDQNIRALARLIDDLLDVSRISTGKFAVDTRPILLAPVIESALEAIRPEVELRHLKLDTRIEARDLVINGDAGRLQQAVRNLLSNAVKFTPKDGRIELALTANNGEAILTVRDSGIGFASDFKAQIFERFKQADSSTTRRYGGLGLGLSIVRHVVELHGGSVAASSDGPGQGAVFTIKLPVCNTQAIFATPSNATSLDPHLLTGLTVMVVEDESDARALIAMVLERSGAKVLSADSVRGALDILARETPDVLISDIGMPDEDGYSLVRKVRAMEGTLGRIPAAAITAYAKSEDRQAALSAGFQRHLPKPLEPDVLTKLVAELAQQHGSAAKVQDAQRN